MVSYDGKATNDNCDLGLISGHLREKLKPHYYPGKYGLIYFLLFLSVVMTAIAVTITVAITVTVALPASPALYKL